MARVEFTKNVQSLVPCPPTEASGHTVREVLDGVFAEYDSVRGYVLDEHGGLRTHMVIFVNGEPVQDRAGLSDPVDDDAEVYVIGALSGG